MSAATIFLIGQWVAAETTHIWRVFPAPVLPFSLLFLEGARQEIQIYLGLIVSNRAHAARKNWLGGWCQVKQAALNLHHCAAGKR